uniref:zinc finger protein 280B isoform X5 n=1 Tax=Ictidomys tridecemlineatus TaxID=43179 RepID=UPI001A9ED867|nr:zinc finger protein 280B isoform X5 [Ictidomys tridecemlineatus]
MKVKMKRNFLRRRQRPGPVREAPAPLIPKIADHSPLMSWNRKLQHKQEPGSFLTASSLFKDVNLNLRFCYDPPPGPPQELEEHRMD